MYIAKRYGNRDRPDVVCLFVCVLVRYDTPSASRRACGFSSAMFIVLDGMEYENELSGSQALPETTTVCIDVRSPSCHTTLTSISDQLDHLIWH